VPHKSQEEGRLGFGGHGKVKDLGAAKKAEKKGPGGEVLALGTQTWVGKRQVRTVEKTDLKSLRHHEDGGKKPI